MGIRDDIKTSPSCWPAASLPTVTWVMQFKHVVERGLRQLSLWIVDGWYSDVHVEGASNVPETGPLIL